MRKINILTSEKILLEKALKEGYVSSKPTDTIRVLIKHYLQHNKKTDEIIKLVEEVLRKDRKYRQSEWSDMIKKMTNTIKKSNNYIVYHVEKAEIMQEELEIIRDLDNLELEKIAFSALVRCKILNQINTSNNNWVYPDKDLYDDALINKNIKEKQKMIYELKIRQLVTTANKITNPSFRVDYLHENGKVLLKINHFDRLIYYYLIWRGEKNISECDECKRYFQKKNNKNKYCKVCAKEVDKQKRRERHKKSKFAEIENPPNPYSHKGS